MPLWLCGFLLLLTSVPGSETKTLVARLEARYRSAHTLQASFFQRYTESGRQVRAEAGTVYFRRPGKMRWDYESPERNVFLVDGKTAWFYVPADHTVTRTPAKQSADWRTPLALLAGEMKISRVCDQINLVDQPSPETPLTAVLSCVLRGPRKSSQGPRESGDAAYFEVIKSSGELVRVLVTSPGGTAIEFRFANWRTDPPVDEALFHFTVPPGVAIVNGDSASGQDPANP